MMGTTSNQFQRYTWRGPCVALLSVLTIFALGASATVASAAGGPGVPMVVSQNATLGALPGGGAFSGEDPAGGSMAVNSMGVAVAGDTYGGDVVEFAPPSYTPTKIEPSGASENVGAVAIDSSNFLYVADQYNNNIVKIPMNADGTYTMTVSTEGTVSSLPACLGDTKGDASGECLISNPGTAIGAFGVSSMTFSSSGTLFFATDDQGDSGGVGPAFSIFDCNALCLYGTTAPVLVFAEQVTPSGSVAQDGQYYIGGLAVDAFGNLFFTDSAETNSSLASAQSNLWELPVVTKTINPTLFAANPINILNFVNTPAGSAPYYGNYDNAIDAVATDSKGHLYVSIIYSGIYGLVDNGSLNGSDTGAATVSGSSLYGIANQVQTKLLASDNNGNFYALGNGSGDTLYFLSTGSIKFTGATVNAVVADNTEPCTPTIGFATAGGATVTGATGTCSGMYQIAGSFVPVTLTNTGSGYMSGTLAITDQTSNASLQQNVSSSGAGITLSQGTYGAALPSGGGWGGSSPDGHTGAINSKGVIVFGTSYGNQVTMYTNVAGVTTLFGGTGGNGVAGTLNGAGGMAIDSSDNLYMSSEYGNTVYKVAPNADGSYGPWTADSNNNPLNSAGAAPVACVGGAADVTAGICSINLGDGNYNFGIAGLAVDASGNLFITSDNQATNSNGTYAPNSVFECNTTCLYGSTPTPLVALYSEPIGGSGNPQLIPGSISLDAADNVYFTDSSLSSTGTEYSLGSNVNELPVDASNVSTGYANNPTVLTTLTPACTNLSGCNYNDAITTVSVDASGNVFFGTPYDGVYELANNSGTLSTVPWGVSGQSTKTIVPDGKGNFYFLNYNSKDTTGYVTLGSVVAGTSASPALPGTPATVTNVTAIDNGASCQSGQGNLSFTALDTDFTAVESAGNNCGTLPFGSGARFPVTVSFNPSASASGAVSTTITATNSNSGDTGTASVSGFAATAQPITFTNPSASESIAYTTTPIVLAATGGASGNPVTFSVASGPATLGADGVTLTITGVGAVVVNAAQAGGTVGSTTYAPGSGSITITVNQAPQTIGYTGPSSIAFTTTPIDLSTVTTGGASGEPVTFTLVSGPATLTGTNLTLTGVGSVVVNADQIGNTDYTAATELPIDITVTQATQTITFNPPSYVTSTAPITLSATSTSGLPVSFAVTSGPGSLGSGSNSNILTPSGSGTIVVTASQAGNANFAAAASVQGSIAVTLTAVATPTITPATGSTLVIGTSPNVTIADATAGATIVYTTDGTNPLTSNTAQTYTSAGIAVPATPNSAWVITAAASETGFAPSATATATYVVTAVPPNFTMSSTSTSVSITPSTPATVTFTVTGLGGFNSAITFACLNPPTGVSCSFSPSTLTPSGATPVSTTLTISESGSAALHHNSNPFVPAGATFAAALCFLGWKKRRVLMLTLVLVAGVIAVSQFTGCGGSSVSTPTIPTSNMFVTATGGGAVQTLRVTVNTK